MSNTIDDLKSLMNGQGQVGMKVLDSQSNLKEEHKYTRINGEGAVKAVKEQTSGAQEISTEDKSDNFVWKVKRRDKVPGLGKGRPDDPGNSNDKGKKKGWNK